MTAPVDERLLERAREIARERDGVPSRSALQKSLQVSWPKAVEVFQALVAEASRDRAERAAKRDAIASRRRNGATPEGSSGRRRARLLHQRSPRTVVDDQIPAEQVREGATAAAEELSPKAGRKVRAWPVLLLALPAFVAIWSGWVDLGRLTGFGVVHPLPGIADRVALNTAITLPIGLETYAAYALSVWLSGAVPARARLFAKRSAIGSLVLGAGGQVAYHLMVAAGMARAPWWITTVVACLPVAVLGMGAALAHLVREGR